MWIPLVLVTCVLGNFQQFEQSKTLVQGLEKPSIDLKFQVPGARQGAGVLVRFLDKGSPGEVETPTPLSPFSECSK